MAKKKIYAVRKGNKTGLFYSWDECKKAVHGYSGAEYKGFLTKDEAEAFLNIGKITKGNMIITEMDVSEKMNETISDKIRSTTDKLIVYVDGSFDIHLQKYSFGCVILLEDGRILERYGNGEEPELLAIRNVAGEMYGAMYAVQWAFENGYSSVPKLDDVDYSEKLTQILRQNDIKSVTVLRMEVPCCGGLERAVVTALQNSGKMIPWQVVTFSVDGKILDR